MFVLVCRKGMVTPVRAIIMPIICGAVRLSFNIIVDSIAADNGSKTPSMLPFEYSTCFIAYEYRR